MFFSCMIYDLLYDYHNYCNLFTYNSHIFRVSFRSSITIIVLLFLNSNTSFRKLLIVTWVNKLLLLLLLFIEIKKGGVRGVRIPQNRTELRINTAQNNIRKPQTALKLPENF